MRLTASDRTSLVRLAHSLPRGSKQRRAILSGLTLAGPGQLKTGAVTRLDLKLKSGKDTFHVKKVRTPPQRGKDQRALGSYKLEGKLTLDGNSHTIGGNQGSVVLTVTIDGKSLKPSFAGIGGPPNKDVIAALKSILAKEGGKVVSQLPRQKEPKSRP